MVEIAIVLGLFVLIGGLIWGAVRLAQRGAEDKVYVKAAKKLAKGLFELSNRVRTASMAIARRNAERRRR